MHVNLHSSLPPFIYFGAADHEEIEALPFAPESLKQFIALATVGATTTTTTKNWVCAT